MSKKASLALVITLFLNLAVTIRPVVSGATVVKVNPALIEYHEDATGQQFTVAIKIVDVTNLYGFDIKLRWNTTFLNYVSHFVHVPKDSYTDGVLWNPIIPPWEDQVNATTGTYWVACASRYPAPSFNGTGTVFNMTFAVVHHPVQPQPDANITLQLYSTDLSNNVGAAIPHTSEDGIVKLYALPGASHDVAVTNVTSLKRVICLGFTGNVTVTVENLGGNTETFNVTTYANCTATGNTTSIAAFINVTLVSGASTSLVSVWNTTGFAKGNYTLSAYAWPVQGETDTADNNFTGGWVVVSMVGDLTGGSENPWDFVPDGVVDGSDLSMVAKCYGSWPAAPPPMIWNANCDVNNDGVVDGSDLAIIAKHFGEGGP
jgi:hypothetical protein